MTMCFTAPAHSSQHRPHTWRTAPISRLAHHHRTFLCNAYIWNPLSDCHFLQLHWLGHTPIWNPPSISSKSLCSVSYFPVCNNFRFLKDCPHFLLILRTSWHFGWTSWPSSALSFVSPNRYGWNIFRQHELCQHIFCGLWSGRSRIWGIDGRITCNFRTEGNISDCRKFPSWQ